MDQILVIIYVIVSIILTILVILALITYINDKHLKLKREKIKYYNILLSIKLSCYKITKLELIEVITNLKVIYNNDSIRDVINSFYNDIKDMLNTDKELIIDKDLESLNKLIKLIKDDVY